MKNTDWLFICDVDAFLVIHDRDQTVPFFLDGRHLKEAGFIVRWKTFGTSDRHSWKDRLVHRTFTNAAATKRSATMFYKSFIYQPRHFRILGAHDPYGFNGPGKWAKAQMFFTAQTDLTSLSILMTNKRCASKQHGFHMRGAQLNHNTGGTPDMLRSCKPQLTQRVANASQAQLA